MGSTRSPLTVLVFSLIGISFAAPLVRLSHAPPLVIAAWRLGFSLVIIAIALTLRGEWRAWRTLSRGEFALTGAAGLLLALHFWSWNASLQYTTVAASVSLVNLQPVIIALVSSRWLGERASRQQWVGIGVAVVGALVVGLADVPGGLSGVGAALTGGADEHGVRGRAILGDLLACVGAVTAAFYYLIGDASDARWRCGRTWDWCTGPRVWVAWSWRWSPVTRWCHNPRVNWPSSPDSRSAPCSSAIPA